MFSTSLAYFSKIWPGLLPYCFTWCTWVDWKSRSLRANLARMFETSGVHNPKRVSATILESHSKTTSLIRTSHAKDTPTSMAFALTSNGPKDWWNFLLKLSWLCPMITDYHTNSQLPRLSKNCHIHIHLVAWNPR